MTIQPYRKLLDFIAIPESGGDYNIVWGRIKKQHQPPKPLVQMTIGQVLDWQDSIDRLYMSEAAGKYQIMEDTLRGLYAQAGLSKSDLFNEKNQDRLAVQLLRRRGLDRFIAGKIDAKQFAQKLSMEWASLPAITIDKRGRKARGQSYYAGDGLNESHVSIRDVLAMVETVKDAPPVRPDAPTPPKQPATGLWAWLRRALGF